MRHEKDIASFPTAEEWQQIPEGDYKDAIVVDLLGRFRSPLHAFEQAVQIGNQRTEQQEVEHGTREIPA